MGIYTVVFPLSGIIAMTTFGAIGIAWGWRAIMWALFALNIGSFIFFAIYFRNPPLHPDENAPKKAVPFSTIFKMGWPIWALAATWGVSSLSNNAVGTFTPDFLYQNGFDLRIAGIITSITLICGLVMSPVVGYISDRSRYKEAFLVVGGLLGTLVLLLIPIDIDRIVLYMIVLGVFAGPAVAVIFAMAATLVKREMMPLAYGAVASCSHAGMFIGPYVSGFIRDVSGSYQYSYWFASIFFLVVAILMGLLMARNIRIARASV
jgi:MFS family permease